MRRIGLFTLLMVSGGLSCFAQEAITAQYQLTGYRYWFDTDKEAKTASYISGNHTFDVSSLDEGMHTLHYQVLTSDGSVSPARTASFFRIAESSLPIKDCALSGLRYWFDCDKTARRTAYAAGIFTLDVSELEEGMHTLHYQVLASDGSVSPARTASFFRIAESSLPIKNYALSGVRYWFDCDKTARQTAYAAGTFTLDVSELEEGLHTLHYQALASDGSVAPARTASFFRIPAESLPLKDYELGEVTYWIDEDLSTAVTAPYTGGVFQLDVAQYAEGEHILYYQLKTAEGEGAPVMSATIDRRLYDIYISSSVEYSQAVIDSEPLFASRPDLKLHHDLSSTEKRGHLTVTDEATLSLGKYVHSVTLGTGAYSGKLNTAGEGGYHLTTLINNGVMRADSVIVRERLYRDRWHFLSMPFNVSMAEIVTPAKTYKAIRSYDGAQRAAGNLDATWADLGTDATLEAGKGYIVQLTSADSVRSVELTFKSVNDPRKNDIFTTEAVSVALDTHESEFAHNRSWNLVGNPYPSFFDTRYLDMSGTITVWNGAGYTAYSLEDDNYILMPFEAFFVQKPIDKEALSFDPKGRQHDSSVRQVETATRTSAALRKSARQIINLDLTDGNYTDHTRVVFNDEASSGYEADKDAPKFMSENRGVAQIYSEESGVKYAINERPRLDGSVILTVYIPADGDYTISLADFGKQAEEVYLTDKETRVVTDLSMSDYSFRATQGTHSNRFALGGSEGVGAIESVDETEDATLTIGAGVIRVQFTEPTRVTVYGVDGRVWHDATVTERDIRLPQGAYVVSANGEHTTVIVK